MPVALASLLSAAPLDSGGALAGRLLLAAALGALVGLEREVRGHEAGLRTCLLVCVGSALVMIVSVRMAAEPWAPAGDYRITIDPARIAYGVMAGVGFLGAGTILHSGGTVRGLTTAAALWCVAAIGLASGLGFVTAAGATTGIVLVALTALNALERHIPQAEHYVVTMRAAYAPGRLHEARRFLRDHGVRVRAAGLRRIDENGMELRLGIVCGGAADLTRLERAVEESETFSLAGIEPG